MLYRYFRVGVETIAQLVGFTPYDLYWLLHSRPNFHWGYEGERERERERFFFPLLEAISLT